MIRSPEPATTYTGTPHRGRDTSTPGAEPPTLRRVDQAAPHTVSSLAYDLRTLGVIPGDVLLLHSSYQSLGFVAGGTEAVVLALLAALGPEGTLVVPTHTPVTGAAASRGGADRISSQQNAEDAGHDRLRVVG